MLKLLSNCYLKKTSYIFKKIYFLSKAGVLKSMIRMWLLALVPLCSFGQAGPMPIRPNMPLDSLAYAVLAAPYDSQRVMANTWLIHRLEDTLSLAKSYSLDFEALRSISRLRSKDDRFQIWTWQLPRKGGRFDHFGFIIMPDEDENRLVSLVDTVKSYELPHYQQLSPDNWYGAIYYSIETVKAKGREYYVLLGFDQNDLVERRKLIEVVSFAGKNDRMIRFGERFFDVSEFQGMKMERAPYRLFMRYGAERTSMLRWDKKEEQILMDHLVPDDASMKSMYRFYGPDFSYDALVFKKGKWNLELGTEFQSDINSPIRPPDKERGLPPPNK